MGVIYWFVSVKTAVLFPHARYYGTFNAKLCTIYTSWQSRRTANGQPAPRPQPPSRQRPRPRSRAPKLYTGVDQHGSAAQPLQGTFQVNARGAPAL